MNNINTKLFNKRIFILLLAKFLLIFILVSRLFFLQIKENFYFYRLSERNRTNLIPIIPKRGLILDNFQVILADNVFLWEVLFIKSNINKGIELFINTLSSIIVISEAEKERIIKDYKNHPAYYPILIKQNISQSEIAAIETFSYNLPGVFIRPFYRRGYKLKEEMFHLLGYTTKSDTSDRNQNISEWYLGKSGLELTLDSFLKGEVGYSKYEINAKGEAIRKLDQTPSKQGDNLYLTIDSFLQSYAYNLISDFVSASVIVNDVHTGDILALASYPSVDPNIFSQGISDKDWRNLSNSELAPLSNKVIQGSYPPGSTIKSIIALKALQLGIIDYNTKITCNGSITVGRDKFHCWKTKGHHELNLKEAIIESCDVFFYEVAKKLKPSDLIEIATQFGGNKKHLPILAGEKTGSLPNNSPNYKPTLGDMIVSTIGQGTWLITPIQLAYMTSLLANGGHHINFNVIKKIEHTNKIIYPKNNDILQTLPYNKEYIEYIRSALFDVINSKKGTGQLASTNDPSWQLAGKTGTAQVRRITLAERDIGVISNNDLPWNRRDHALFTGFVPFNNPTYAITTIVEHGGSGSIASAIITKKIAQFLKERHHLYEIEKENIKNILKET